LTLSSPPGILKLLVGKTVGQLTQTDILFLGNKEKDENQIFSQNLQMNCIFLALLFPWLVCPYAFLVSTLPLSYSLSPWFFETRL
jgi:hypothetical protein